MENKDIKCGQAREMKSAILHKLMQKQCETQKIFECLKFYGKSVFTFL